MAEMRKSGVQFYTPTADELEQWVQKGGHQNAEWDSYKNELAGSIANFDMLLEAANIQGRFYVNDA